MPDNDSNFNNDWTVMFFFASDNRLAPLLVSELKAIKDAGFQEHTEVIVYYDPLEKGCPTKIYNVNSKRKAFALTEWENGKKVRKSVIGDGNDSYVRKMDGDEVDAKNFSDEMQEAMANSSKAPVDKMLGYFLDYVLANHTAKNYILFLIGHGMIVGSDIFLPDDDPVSAVTMKQLKKIMGKFVQGGKTSLQLLALHSCSMSSIEVAYQLRGTANYMMAHQGPAFVNSWNYRQVLKKILNTINKEKRDEGANARTREERERLVNDKQIGVKTLVDKLYYHSLYNATDFLSAGYSADLALYSLEEDKLARIKEPIQLLVRELKANIAEENSLVKDLILLAHWESQSFWEENYTDLYDFCLCLSRRCNDAMRLYAKLDEIVNKLGRVKQACDRLINVLRIINSDDLSERFKGLVIHADNFGTKYQYARGLSVYFPWCEPLDDEPRESEPQNVASPPEPEAPSQTILAGYKTYDFNTDLGVDSWSSFLELYFEKTKRKSRWDEEHEESGAPSGETEFTEDPSHLLGEAVSEFNVDGSLGTRTPEVGTRTPDTGLDCNCPTIKNYPTVDKKYTPVNQNSPTADKKVLTRRVKQFSITPDALRAFQSESLDVTEDDDTDE